MAPRFDPNDPPPAGPQPRYWTEDLDWNRDERTEAALQLARTQDHLATQKKKEVGGRQLPQRIDVFDEEHLSILSSFTSHTGKVLGRRHTGLGEAAAAARQAVKRARALGMLSRSNNRVGGAARGDGQGGCCRI